MSWGSMFRSNRFGLYDDEEELLENGKENDGRIGLSNIGNTCFMNSALQCIFHNDLLKMYFMNSDVDNEINEQNPLGTKGVLFKEISKLFKMYYRTKSNKVVPSKFKHELGNNNPIFEGYQQHDSQEFWSYVIDMIHEDSNRILTKPYVENIEGTGKEDDFEMARKSWVNYLKRNYSLITDNFIGQYKSRVDCQTPDCNNTSITFDPFTIISLSIPNVQNQDFDILMSPIDEMNNFKEITFASKSSKNFIDIKLGTIKEKLAEYINKNPDTLKIGHFNMRKHGENYQDNDSLSKVHEKKNIDHGQKLSLLFTELNENDIKHSTDPSMLTVYFSTNWEAYDLDEKDSRRNNYEFWMLNREYSEEPVLVKFFYLTGKSTIRDIYVSVLRKLYQSSSLCIDKDQKLNDQSFFEQLWNKIEKEEPNSRFFYIKHNDCLLSRNLLDCTIEKELTIKGGRIDLKVFIRNNEHTNVKVNFHHRVFYENSRYSYSHKTIEFSSETGSTFEKDISLEKLLKKFEDTEILDEHNLWRCPKCKLEVAAKKSMHVYKAPNYLTIHFKKNKSYHNKIPLVTFPIILNFEQFVMNKEKISNYQIKLNEFMSEKDVDHFKQMGRDIILKEPIGTGSSMNYKLFGIVNHYGSQNFGHYTSACDANGKWTEFNDSSTSDISEERLVSDEAYILFYKRI